MAELEARNSPDTPALTWSGGSHVGRFRKNNEDAFLALRFDNRETALLGKQGEAAMDTEDFLFAVSDGMGGAAGGEHASRIAVQEIARLMPKAFQMGASGFERSGLAFLEELFDAIHEKVAYQGRFYDEVKGMGATLSLLWVTPLTVWFGHLGDTRIYHLPADSAQGIRQVSEDHTHVGWLQRQGKLSELQARMHPAKHQLEQSLGGRQRVIHPQLGEIQWQPGDRLVLCTDGVSDALSSRGIENLLREPPRRVADLPPCERIIKESLEASGRDNITCVVVELAG